MKSFAVYTSFWGFLKKHTDFVFTLAAFAIVIGAIPACREDFPSGSGAGGNGHTSTATLIQQPPGGDPSEDPSIRFDLPSGWELDPQNHLRALWPHPSKDHKAPWVLLEFYTLEEAPADPAANDGQGGANQSNQGQGGSGQANQNSGGQAGQTGAGQPKPQNASLLSAKDKALQDYQYKFAKCQTSPVCAKGFDQPHYQELQIGETKVYASESADLYWNEPSWTSLITFEKGGKVVTFLLQDRAEYYHDLFTILVESFKTNIDAQGSQPIKADFFSTFVLEQIPVGNFENFKQGPTDDLTIIQPFATSIDTAMDFAGSKIYGHTGIDLQYQLKGQSNNGAGGNAANGEGNAVGGANANDAAAGGANQNPDASSSQNIYAMYPGLVILSQQASFNAHWGEAIILATRLSANSPQILTQHYYHLAYQNADGHYQTSRRFTSSSVAQSGDILAQQGTSGTWTPHVHVGFRLWQNVQQLQTALENNAEELYGPGYIFDSDEKISLFLDPACAWMSAEDCLGW